MKKRRITSDEENEAMVDLILRAIATYPVAVAERALAADGKAGA